MVNAPSTQPNPGSFAIPAAAVASHPDVILNLRDLRRWIDNLPLANPVKAGSQLLHQLRLLTRDPQPNARFENLLDLYQAPLQQLQLIVNDRLPGSLHSAQPLDQLENLLVELLVELAYGHLRIANHLLAVGKKPTAETLFRAMHLLDGAVNVERLHYRQLSPQRWQLLLSIYLRAELQQIADQPIVAALRQKDDPDTIQALFFRTLIISLCDPHHQAPSEILSWYSWTGRNAALLNLTVLPQGAFAVPIDISGKLAPLTSARNSRPGPETRYLASDRLLQQLEDEAEAPAGLRRALLSLIKGRRAPEQRKAERQPRNHPYQLIHGLRNIHQRLGELTQGAGRSNAEVTPITCRQVNQSRFGAAFRLQAPANPPLSIGEPILAEAHAPSGGGVPVGFAGRIRRVINQDDRQIEIGVEKIQGRLIPVTIVGAAAERSRGDKLALLQHDAETGRYTLLAASSIYREGDSVAAEGPSMRYSLRMLRLGGTAQHIAYIDVEPRDD